MLPNIVAEVKAEGTELEKQALPILEWGLAFITYASKKIHNVEKEKSIAQLNEKMIILKLESDQLNKEKELYQDPNGIRSFVLNRATNLEKRLSGIDSNLHQDRKQAETYQKCYNDFEALYFKSATQNLELKVQD